MDRHLVLAAAAFLGPWTIVRAAARETPCRPCAAGIQTFSATLAPEVPSGARRCDLPSFDAQLGTLRAVEIGASVIVQDARFRIENMDPDHGCQGNTSPTAWHLAVDALLVEPSSTTPFFEAAGLGACSGQIPPLGPFDGALDFGVAGGGTCATTVCLQGSGLTFQCASAAPIPAGEVCIEDPTRLAEFVRASGTVPLFIVSAASNGAEVPCGSYAYSLGVQIGATFRVTYRYEPAPSGTPFCFGDGSLAIECPCGAPDLAPSPSGATGHGCANSFDLDGARLSAAGVGDALRFTASVGTSYVGFAFLVKGDGENALGIASGDGVRCVDGALIRFGGHVAGTAGAPQGCWSYPNEVQTTAVAVATAQATGSTALYQLAYRNSASGFCNPATFNWTNAVRVIWH
ncbi:MAG: choice-of-anchor E domain-containing protein [Planctomycetota bacterium]